jgi:putative ABC transport system permease protein
MKLKLYVRQAWELIRQNKLFSGLYMAGTALAIAMTTTIAVICYVKLAPVYPEVNRMHTSSFTSAGFEKEGQTLNWSVSYKFVENYLRNLKHADLVSAEFTSTHDGEDYVQLTDGLDFPVKARYVDTEYFRLFAYDFLEGKPFTWQDLEAGSHQVVISDHLAQRLYGTKEGIVDRHFLLNNIDYQVCGVMREPSYLLTTSYAQIILPYSVAADYQTNTYEKRFGCDRVGSYLVRFLTHSTEQEDSLRQEVQGIVERLNNTDPEGWKMTIGNQPYPRTWIILNNLLNEEPTPGTVARYACLILLILLLVPALNMSAMISGRMEMRLAEMGVRKSFGASRSTLLSQVLWENFVLTVLGGLIGLVIAWVMILLCKDWMFTIFDRWVSVPSDGVSITVDGEMLFALPVFLLALVSCILLNLMSALIPAWSALRKPIVYSLLQKR